MNIHEYQAKDFFRIYEIPTPEGIVVEAAGEAVHTAEAFGLPVVLKAQVHTGGRGKAGGVKVVQEKEEVVPVAGQILSLTIKDLPVRKLLVSPAVDIACEVYLSLLIDRGARRAVFVGCAEGGVDIEETAKHAPGRIRRLEVAAADLPDLPDAVLADFTRTLFDGAEQQHQVVDVMKKMGRMFLEKDCSLIEINPLVADTQGRVIALDAKVILDDNALFRHPELAAMRDMDATDKDELDAKAAGLSFIRLDGAIGCMVNGAGLAMATMDTIKHFGGEPANFLDVGGSSDPNKVVTAFQMILKDPGVKVVLVNIFGGITRCDDIARGILTALEEFDVSVPIVIRLIGTNEAEGQKLLEGTSLLPASTLEEGAQRATEIGGKS